MRTLLQKQIEQDIRIKQSRFELRHILAREHKGMAREADPARKQELKEYLGSKGKSLRRKQVRYNEASE
jgi:hypothetical protein